MAELPPYKPIESQAVVWMTVAQEYLVNRWRTEIDQTVYRAKAAVKEDVVIPAPMLFPGPLHDQRCRDVRLGFC